MILKRNTSPDKEIQKNKNINLRITLSGTCLSISKQTDIIPFIRLVQQRPCQGGIDRLLRGIHWMCFVTGPEAVVIGKVMD